MRDVRLGPVHLTVAQLDRSVGFYQDALGLRVHAQEPGQARMGVGEKDLLVLEEDPLATPAGRTAGLFHVAYLFASREALADAVLRLTATRTRVSGAADHGVSEAIYLDDPDANGIELYADRPREEWPAPQRPGEKIHIYTAPLDMDDLLDQAGGREPRRHAGPGLVVGHVHLSVGNLAEALGFYRDVLGFQMVSEVPGAAFIAADGYHHHLGLNTWRSAGAPAAPPHTAGLRRFTVRAGDAGEVRERLAAVGVPVVTENGGFVATDPWGIEVEVV